MVSNQFAFAPPSLEIVNGIAQVLQRPKVNFWGHLGTALGLLPLLKFGVGRFWVLERCERVSGELLVHFALPKSQEDGS